MSEIRFPLPDVGEGLTEAEIVQWRVAPGDRIALDQVFVEIETAKSLVELPSAFEGVVSELLVDEGNTVDVGTPILVIQTDGGGADAATSAPSAAAASAAAPVTAEPAVGATVASHAAAPSEGGGAVLVGHGSSGPCGHASEAASVTRRRAREPRDRPGARRRSPGGTGAARPGRRPGRRRRGPRCARRCRVPIRECPSSRSRRSASSRRTSASTSRASRRPVAIGDITRDDVIRSASQVSVFRNIQTPEWPTDREDRIPVKGVRKAIANAMVQSAYSAPHVSVFVDVDATRTMEYVKRLKASPDYAGVRVSPLLIMAKAMIWAVRRNPSVNAQWTDEEIIVKHYVNLGVAAATPRGLIVPNVKEAQAMTMVELATALEQLTLTAREGKTQPAEMQGGTITITNIGVFGMDTGTPILNPGEVAIVALGTIKQKPWVVDGEVRPRFVTTVGASFDHRVVDGDVASRFLADVASIIEEPALLLE